MNGAVLGGAGSTLASASSTCVARTACSAAITSSTLSRPVTRGRSRKLEVLTPRINGAAALSLIEPTPAASGTPAMTTSSELTSRDRS